MTIAGRLANEERFKALGLTKGTLRRDYARPASATAKFLTPTPAATGNIPNHFPGSITPEQARQALSILQAYIEQAPVPAPVPQPQPAPTFSPTSPVQVLHDWCVAHETDTNAGLAELTQAHAHLPDLAKAASDLLADPELSDDLTRRWRNHLTTLTNESG